MDLSAVKSQLARVNWSGGWLACTYAESVSLGVQLGKEVEPGHLLHGRKCVALARSGLCEDVLYFGEGDPPVLAVVHLSWRVPRGRDRFPWTYPFASVAEWERDWMKRAMRG